ncbi:MAG: LCP family protein [Cellulosilyticaceae bacterium]
MKKLENKKKKKPLLYLFLKSGSITLIAILLLALGVFVFHNTFSHKSDSTQKNEVGQTTKTPKKPFKKNIVLFGVDKGSARTDTIMVVHIDSEIPKASVVSIPRDTKVFWTDEQQNEAEELDRNYSPATKITDMSSLGGIAHLRDFTVKTLEDLLGITIDNYFVVNTSILREVVDTIGGLEFEVPRVMEYSDPYQDLYIDLQPGLQTLNGEQAEGVLRWRHNNSYSEQYGEGDVGRIQTQQLFIKTLLNKILSPENFKNLIPLVKTTYENVITDMSLFDALSYIPYLNSFSSGNVTMDTLPGEAVREDLWYYIVDETEVAEFIQKIFYSKPTPSPSPTTATPSSTPNLEN